MARRPKPEPVAVQLATRLPLTLHRELKAACDERGVSMSKLVERFIRKGLRELPPLGDE